MKTLTINVNSQAIEITVTLDEVVDYNLERDNEEYDEKAVCANVMGDIGDARYFGQVQWDSQNNEYSTDCDGNALYDEIKDALLSNFNDELLEDEYGIARDLRVDLENEVLPKVVKFICDFGENEINKFLA